MVVCCAAGSDGMIGGRGTFFGKMEMMLGSGGDDDDDDKPISNST